MAVQVLLSLLNGERRASFQRRRKVGERSIPRRRREAVKERRVTENLSLVGHRLTSTVEELPSLLCRF
jgi:hypothetical protein